MINESDITENQPTNHTDEPEVIIPETQIESIENEQINYQDESVSIIPETQFENQNNQDAPKENQSKNSTGLRPSTRRKRDTQKL